MDRNSFISSFKKNIMNRAPRAFILFLVIVLAIECGIHLLSPCIAANSAYLGIKARIMVTQIEDINRDILIFGDSSAGVGISPKKLHEDTGLPCANLATRVGTTIAANHFLFQSYLKANKPPKYMILMRGFNAWSEDPSNTTIELLLSNFPGKIPELLVHPRLIGSNYRTLLREIFVYLLPSQRNRWPIRRTISEVIKNKKTIPVVLAESKQEVALFEQHILGEIQHIGTKGTEEQRERSLLKQMKFVRENEFSVSPWKNYYLEQLITLAEQKGVTVFICLPPVRREIYEDEAGREYLQSNKAFIENVCRSHDNVVLLTDDFYFVTADQITDNGNHLNAEESIMFTDMLAQKLLEFIDSHEK